MKASSLPKIAYSLLVGVALLTVPVEAWADLQFKATWNASESVSLSCAIDLVPIQVNGVNAPYNKLECVDKSKVSIYSYQSTDIPSALYQTGELGGALVVRYETGNTYKLILLGYQDGKITELLSIQSKYMQTVQYICGYKYPDVIEPTGMRMHGNGFSPASASVYRFIRNNYVETRIGYVEGKLFSMTESKCGSK